MPQILRNPAPRGPALRNWALLNRQSLAHPANAGNRVYFCAGASICACFCGLPLDFACFPAGCPLPERRYRVLALAAHPVQYMSPILRKMAGQPELDLHVAYCSLRGAEAGYDPEFGATVHWDMPLLEGYPWTHVPNRGSGNESFFGICNTGVWKLIREGEFDAVLCFTGYRCATFWMAILAAKLSRTAFLFGTDAVTLAPRDGRAWKVAPKKILWPWLFRLADQVIVPSSGSRDLMYSLRLTPDRVTLTPYSVDNDWWIEQSSKVDRRAVRAGWGVSETDAVVLFCAKLQPWKRPLDVLRAFAKADIAKAQLVFAGEGPLRGQLESEAASLGIGDRMRFLGFVNQTQLPAIYTAADLMVLSSEYDAFAVVVNEAMCCGCPVVASDKVGAARDLVAPVAPEFVYPCGDVEALSKVLRSAVSDRSRLASLAAAASRRIASWSPKENIAGTIEAVRIAVSRIRREPRHTSAAHAVPPSSPAGQQKLPE
jgi:glycosyltransferase involved in cell wall biosynthesis